MTREEALRHFKEQLDIFGGEHAEAIKVAIEALSEETPTIQEKHQLSEETSTNTSTNTSTKSTNISTDTSADRPRGEWIDKEELIDAINDAQFVYDSDEGGHKEYDITELVRVIFKDIISNLSSADMRGEDE